MIIGIFFGIRAITMGYSETITDSVFLENSHQEVSTPLPSNFQIIEHTQPEHEGISNVHVITVRDNLIEPTTYFLESSNIIPLPDSRPARGTIVYQVTN